MADPQPHPVIGLADVAVDRTQPVVAGMAAAGLDPAFARRQVKLVVKHGDVLRRELVEPHRLAHRLAGAVHEGVGLEQQQLVAAQPAFGHTPLKAGFPRAEAVRLGDPVDRHEADVVPVARILPAGIAQTHENLHLLRSSGSVSLCPLSGPGFNAKSPGPAPGAFHQF